MTKMIRTFIVDDEFHAREVLKYLITRYCPNLDICGEADSTDNAIAAIQQLRPDLVFLDVDLGAGNAFELLDAFPNPGFKVIFTTAHENFAVKAFQYRVLYYLLKPIDAQELVKITNELKPLNSEAKMLELVKKIPDAGAQGVLSLPTTQGVVLLRLDEIAYIHAEDRYVYVFIDSGEKIFISQSLKAIELHLPPDSFLKPHQSYIVRLDAVRKIQKTSDGLYLVLKNKTLVPISRRNKDAVLRMFGL